MTVDPRDAISDFTEMTDEELLRMFGSFFRAIGWGAAAGGGIFLFLTVPIGIAMLFDGEIPSAAIVSLLPLLAAGAGTLIGMIVIAIPLTFLLRHMGCERAKYYARCGMIAGALLPFAVLTLLGFGLEMIGVAVFLGVFGAMAGRMSGTVWGDFRQSLYEVETLGEADGRDPATNPFHDMIH